MTIESDIFDTLKGLVSSRVYPDIAPPEAPTPYITYQQVGGDPVNFLDTATPSKRNARMQVNVWATTRAQAALIGAQVEQAMRAASALQTTVMTGMLATYDELTGYRGTMQDFSVWGDA